MTKKYTAEERTEAVKTSRGSGNRTVNDALREAVRKWNLRELNVIYQNPGKAVCSAVSASYGSVILKCDRTPQLLSEYRMLDRLDGTSACKVYAFDAENGWLLEERILPGTVLRKEPSLEQRISAFANVFHAVHRPETDGETYLDWLHSINKFCQNNPVEPELAEMTAESYDICAEMFAKYPERMLLHGDLHHDNLLLREDGTYAMIDPKGVVGPAILDVPRFILNEFDTAHDGSDAEHITEAIRQISECLGYPLNDVQKLFFMETVLENMWSYEDGEPISREELTIAQKIKNK